MFSMVMLGYVSALSQYTPQKANFLHRQWDPKYRIKVRVICARAYHALFMVRLHPARDFSM